MQMLRSVIILLICFLLVAASNNFSNLMIVTPPLANKSIIKKSNAHDNVGNSTNSLTTYSNPLANSLLTGTLNMNTPEYVVLRPLDEVTFSSETTASILTISIKEGSHFTKGDTLLTFDCRVQQAELNKSLAQKESTGVAKKSALKLKSYGSISEYELVKAISEDDALRADIEKLTAIVDKCKITAPFSGAVAQVMVHAHETVKPGDPLIKILDTESLILEMEVPSAWLQWLHIGDVFQVHVNELNKMISAVITRINPQINSISQTVKIIGTLNNPDPQLLPGMSGQAHFPDKDKK